MIWLRLLKTETVLLGPVWSDQNGQSGNVETEKDHRLISLIFHETKISRNKLLAMNKRNHRGIYRRTISCNFFLYLLECFTSHDADLRENLKRSRMFKQIHLEKQEKKRKEKEWIWFTAKLSVLIVRSSWDRRWKKEKMQIWRASSRDDGWGGWSSSLSGSLVITVITQPTERTEGRLEVCTNSSEEPSQSFLFLSLSLVSLSQLYYPFS